MAQNKEVDVVVVGAGFAGLYAIIRLRRAGFSVRCFETGDDVGGTWYWNRYPGARCDVPTTDYTYSFDPDLEDAWAWSEKFATQPEILSYLRFVADRFGLRRDISFSTRVESASWDDGAGRWRVTLDDGTTTTCRFFIMATGCLSVPKSPDVAGVEDFAGEVYSTGRWPHSDVDFSGKRVAVIGTGSSGVQAIPVIARQAAHLTVFQRTPSFSLPAFNGPPLPESVEWLARDREGYRQRTRAGNNNNAIDVPRKASWQLTPAERRERFEAAWTSGALGKFLATVWDDVVTDLDANAMVVELFHEKIRGLVEDPVTAAALCPTDYPFVARRPCLDTGYYETFNRSNVTLVDIHRDPIERIVPTGIVTSAGSHDFDAIVFATGFDAMTGAALAVRPITGRRGVTLAEAWKHGPRTYLGLTVAGFPNLFLITGPGSPSVLTNMALSIEQHVEWVVDRLEAIRDEGFSTIEATDAAQDGWSRHMADCASVSLQRFGRSWYVGANVEGKPQGVMPYTGGLGLYRDLCDEVVERNMIGFRLSREDGSGQCEDGEIVRLQPDIHTMLRAAPPEPVPPLQSLGVEGARSFVAGLMSLRPPARPAGSTADGAVPVSGDTLAYRLYRPATPGPHPVLVYFHGGGWVLGSHVSDEPLCLDLCRRSDMVVISVGYRHAPEHRFPTAAEDGYASLCWIADHLDRLGGRQGPILVAGYSAGGNVAAVVCQLARDRGGPEIAAQLLICPVVDHDFTRPSYDEAGAHIQLSRDTMAWFWDQYCDPADRADPRASPLRGTLDGLPPAIVVTSEFDVLRDEGAAYAEKLSASGVAVTHLLATGHTHASLTAAGVVLTGAPVRERIAAELCRFGMHHHKSGEVPDDRDDRRPSRAFAGERG